jgi:hypothetical protein
MKVLPEELLRRIEDRFDKGGITIAVNKKKPAGKFAGVEILIRLEADEVRLFADLLKVRMD